MNKIRQYVVDAFTKELFKGNPAAVIILENWLPEKLMQSIAKENNLSETAFCVKEGDRYHLRWFTPVAEIDFCGHATLATSFILLNYYEKEESEVIFTTMRGQLSVKRIGKELEMTMPAYQYKEIEVTEAMEDIFGVKPNKALLGRDLVCVFDDEEIVRTMNPDEKKLSELGYFGYCVTAPGRDYDCVSRYFAPELAIMEDPVTGSVHCLLAPYWSSVLKKNTINAFQASERTGSMRCICEENIVKIYGEAVLYSRSEINISNSN